MKKKAVLILGGGAALGLAHAGVLASLEKRFEICGIVGTSMGAIVGALYACGYTPKEMLNLAEDFRSVEVFNPLNLDFSLSGIFDGKTTLRRFNQWTQDREISSGRIPFIAVAYDLNTSTSVLIDKGKYGPAMRASSSVPYIYAPFSYGEYLFVDGGVEHPLPTAFKNQLDENAICIAVNVLPQVNMQAQAIKISDRPPAKKTRLKSHQVFLQSAMQNQGFIALQAMLNHKPDIIIDAWHSELSVLDIDKAKEFYEFGYTQSQRVLAAYSEPGFIDIALKRYQNMIEKISVFVES